MKSIFKDKEEAKIDKKIKLEEKIIEKLFQYQEKTPEVLFCALNKYLSTYSLYFDNSGYIGIADQNFSGVYYVGDILTHSYKDVLKAGDTLHVRYYGPDPDVFYLHHIKFKSFGKSGYITTEEFEGGESHIIHRGMVLGVLIEVTPFKGERWEQLFDDLNGGYDWLKTSIEGSLDFYKSNDEIPTECRNNVIPELERRLGLLEG
jgi:hypothetical protein